MKAAQCRPPGLHESSLQGSTSLDPGCFARVPRAGRVGRSQVSHSPHSRRTRRSARSNASSVSAASSCSFAWMHASAAPTSVLVGLRRRRRRGRSGRRCRACRAIRIGNQPQIVERAAFHRHAVADALAGLVGDHRDRLRAADQDRVLERLALAREPADLLTGDGAPHPAERAVGAGLARSGGDAKRAADDGAAGPRPGTVLGHGPNGRDAPVADARLRDSRNRPRARGPSAPTRLIQGGCLRSGWVLGIVAPSEVGDGRTGISGIARKSTPPPGGLALASSSRSGPRDQSVGTGRSPLRISQRSRVSASSAVGLTMPETSSTRRLATRSARAANALASAFHHR